MGSGAKPTLTEKSVTEFDPSGDVARILKTPATNEFDPTVNQVPVAGAQARSYAERAKERAAARMGADALKGPKVPIGHAPPLPRDKMEQLANLRMPQPVFDHPEQDRKTVNRPPQPQGVGAAYDVNQAMARGDLDRPVTLREAKNLPPTSKGLSPESIKAIQMANENIAGRPQEDLDAEKEVAASMRSAPSATDPQGRELDKAEKTIVDTQQDERPQAEERPMPFDFEGLMGIKNVLMEPERRKKIESRLDALDISDMIMKREIQQEVTIIPGKLAVTLRTFNQKENLWTLQYIFDFPGSTLYTRELLSTCQLVCSIVAINSKMLPEHRTNVGQPNEQIDRVAFEKKKDAISSFPVALIADLSVQHLWFQDRVNKLFSFEALKNG